MGVPDTLDSGRMSFARQAWGDAYAQLSAAERERPLAPEDLERLATAAHLFGRDADSAEIWARAHQEFLSRGNPDRAARCAFWLALGLLYRGDRARGSGWLARARRLLDDGHLDCVERGYLLVPVALDRIGEGDTAAAYATFSQAAKIGDRFRDRDLMTLGRLGQGQALIGLNETAAGVALLDEVMVGVTAGEVSPIAVGIVYCAVIETCHDIFDFRRAQEWTSAMTRWCEDQGDRVSYRGHCLIRRAEIMQLHGAWPDALDEAERAREWLSQPPPHRAVGSAFYRLAELHRLRGEFPDAEQAYQQASRWGRKPQPGLSRLRLAQGQVEAAVAAIRLVLGEAKERRNRVMALAAYVDIMLAAQDLPAARAAADELSAIAADFDAPVLRSVADEAQGAVLLAEGDARAALDALRSAWMAWRDLEAPYEAARVRVLVGLACRALGDHDAGEMEMDAASQAFQQLGASPDLARVRRLSRTPVPAARGLTAREVQVLGLVATGKTNRAIAGDLRISEKTVARHVSNIFTKLGLSSRAAATAYAYQHDLV